MFSIIAKKQCTKCEETKSIADFPEQPGRKDGHHSWCKKCHAKAAAQWNKDNPEKFNEHRKNWRKKNPEDPALKRARTRRWRKDNPDKHREKVRKWQKANPEKTKAFFNRWLDANRGRFMESVRAYQARKKGSGGKIKPEEWQKLKEFYNYTCLRCHRREPEIKLTLDHVVPLKLGGMNTIDNAQPLCKSCNSGKGAKIADYR
jgi:5-methylcytosine-specific restriction endonuclease McrA